MKNKDVIELINRIVNPKTEHEVYTVEEALVAVLHGYYYIKPGKNTKKFVAKLNKLFNRAILELEKSSGKTQDGVPCEDLILGKMAGEAVLMASDMFDEKFFKHMSNVVEIEEELIYNSLDAYVNMLTFDELVCVFDGVNYCKEKYDAFFDDEVYDNMWDEIYNRCREAGSSMPNPNTDWYNYVEYANNNPNYLFSYLDVRSAIDIVRKYMDSDFKAFEYMLKVLNNADKFGAIHYTSSAFIVDRFFELNVFAPVITDLKKINRNTIDIENSKRAFVKGNREFMIAPFAG